ncbi:MAG: hypothetical protein ACKOGJ_10660 [Phycisphaerales bacterium]
MPLPAARIALACSLALAALTLAACAQRRPVQDEQDLLRERAALKE